MTAHPVADCRLHILDSARFPYDPAAPYVPEPHETAAVSALEAVHAAHGVTYALLVGPTSGYGRDNRCLLDVVAQGGGRWRGIALAAPEAAEWAAPQPRGAWGGAGRCVSARRAVRPHARA